MRLFRTHVCVHKYKGFDMLLSETESGDTYLSNLSAACLTMILCGEENVSLAMNKAFHSRN